MYIIYLKGSQVGICMSLCLKILKFLNKRVHTQKCTRPGEMPTFCDISSEPSPFVKRPVLGGGGGGGVRLLLVKASCADSD